MKWWNRSWNPVSGCTECSEGCDNCYVKVMIEKRKKAEPNLTFNPRVNMKQLNKKFDNNKEFIQVVAQGDLFHHYFDEVIIDKVFSRMTEIKNKSFALLTKRSSYMKEYFSNCEKVYDFERMIFGVTVENNKRQYRIDDLLETEKIKYRFLNIEPLMEEMSIDKYLKTGKINWVVIGCETGENARECKIEWIEKIVTECEKNKVPVFVNFINNKGIISDDLTSTKINKRQFFDKFKLY